MLVRDISFLQDQHQHLSEKLWRSGHTVQQLNVQVNQVKTSLAQSNLTLRRAQEDLQQQRQHLQHEQREHEYAKKSLGHEFAVHAQTEKRATEEYKTRIERDKYTIDSSEAEIEMLKREKQEVLYTLEEKEGELSKANDQLSALCQECYSDDSEDEEGVQIETATLGKRKRLGE